MNCSFQFFNERVYLFGEIIVEILSWLSSQTNQKFVKVAWRVYHL